MPHFVYESLHLIVTEKKVLLWGYWGGGVLNVAHCIVSRDHSYWTRITGGSTELCHSVANVLASANTTESLTNPDTKLNNNVINPSNVGLSE